MSNDFTASPEVWRPVPYEPFHRHYEVSSLGRVRRVTPHPFGRSKPGILKTQYNARGYAAVVLCAEYQQRTSEIHRMVALAFLNPPTSGQTDVRHLDGNPPNCAVNNLAWGTHAENGKDTIRHGRTTQGAKNRHAKLTDAIVREIKVELRAGHSHTAIAQRKRVSRPTITYIANGKTWRHVD